MKVEVGQEWFHIDQPNRKFLITEVDFIVGKAWCIESNYKCLFDYLSPSGWTTTAKVKSGYHFKWSETLICPQCQILRKDCKHA